MLITSGLQDGNAGMYSTARVKTKLQDGAQAKVTLQATAPGMSGNHSKAIVHVSGPSSSKVVVSAAGKRSSQSKPRTASAKRASSTALLLPGPSN